MKQREKRLQSKREFCSSFEFKWSLKQNRRSIFFFFFLKNPPPPEASPLPPHPPLPSQAPAPPPRPGRPPARPGRMRGGGPSPPAPATPPPASSDSTTPMAADTSGGYQCPASAMRAMRSPAPMSRSPRPPQTMQAKWASAAAVSNRAAARASSCKPFTAGLPTRRCADVSSWCIPWDLLQWPATVVLKLRAENSPCAQVLPHALPYLRYH